PVSRRIRHNSIFTRNYHMKDVIVIDRQTGKKEKEKIMGHSMIRFFYGTSLLSKLCAPLLHYLCCHFHGFSKMYGIIQKKGFSQKQILPFIHKYNIDAKEFEQPIAVFNNFNEFFTRKLKAQSRPIDPNIHHAVCPADGRYLCFQNLEAVKDFWIKG